VWWGKAEWGRSVRLKARAWGSAREGIGVRVRLARGVGCTDPAQEMCLRHILLLSSALRSRRTSGDRQSRLRVALSGGPGAAALPATTEEDDGADAEASDDPSTPTLRPRRAAGGVAAAAAAAAAAAGRGRPAGEAAGAGGAVLPAPLAAAAAAAAQRARGAAPAEPRAPAGPGAAATAAAAARRAGSAPPPPPPLPPPAPALSLPAPLRRTLRGPLRGDESSGYDSPSQLPRFCAPSGLSFPDTLTSSRTAQYLPLPGERRRQVRPGPT
jgi:hypothetical protein